MGGGTFSKSAYMSFAESTSTKSREEIFTSRTIHPSLDPKGPEGKGGVMRESCDSIDNPESTPVICAIDVTGSMGIIGENLARKGLGTLFDGILTRKPVTDPHLMFMAVGDPTCDRAPLQVSQFEADNRITEQLTKIYIEGNGGGNGCEGYAMPWYFAAFHTKTDSFDKRGKRGYLFTVGDEPIDQKVTRDQIKKFIGDDVEADFSAQDLLDIVQRNYDVFHIVITEGNYARHSLQKVKDSWTPLLGQRVIYLDDYTKLAETIVSAIEVAEGGDAADSAKGWGADGSVIHNAIKNLPKGNGNPRLLPPA